MPIETQIHELFTIARSRADLYAAWQDPSMMTRFMPHLRSVTRLEGQQFRSVAIGESGGPDVGWDAEFSQEAPSAPLTWKTLPGAAVQHEGRLTLLDTPGRGTVIAVSLKYDATDDDSSPKLATVIGKEPAKKLREEVRRFKQLMEAGEIPTVEGQSSGRESEERKG